MYFYNSFKEATEIAPHPGTVQLQLFYTKRITFRKTWRHYTPPHSIFGDYRKPFRVENRSEALKSQIKKGNNVVEVPLKAEMILL